VVYSCPSVTGHVGCSAPCLLPLRQGEPRSVSVQNALLELLVGMQPGGALQIVDSLNFDAWNGATISAVLRASGPMV
jgi:hypothetical protein